MLGALTFNAGAWDYEGHHAINELALASLPADFGGFTLTPAMKNRIAFLGGRTRPLAERGRFAVETCQRAGPLH